jgi:hypothetical protein
MGKGPVEGKQEHAGPVQEEKQERQQQSEIARETAFASGLAHGFFFF